MPLTACGGSASNRPSVMALPRVVAAEPPQVALDVAAGVAATAVVLVGDVHDDGGAGGLRPRVMCVGVGNDHAGALGLAHADLFGLGDLPAPFAGVVGRAEHDHAVAEDQLRVVHDVAIGVHGLLLEAEGAAQPLDRRVCVAVAQAGDDGGGGVGGACHRGLLVSGET